MFRDRAQAGEVLGERVRRLGLHDPLVLGLPRGGVVVGAGVAAALRAPLDVLVVRKLGAPGSPELGIGAIAEGGVAVLNDRLIARLRVSRREIDEISAREQRELERRTAAYRRGGTPPSVAGRTVVIVDDGLATGFTARAAVAAARAGGASRVVLAVPVAAPETAAEFASLVDDLVCADTPAALFAVGAAYADFSQTTDDEVERLLAEGRRPPAAETEVLVEGEPALPGTLCVPGGARGLVLFAHGSGSSRHSPRNRFVAGELQHAGLATFLFDLLSAREEGDRRLVFDIPLLASRLARATAWVRGAHEAGRLPIGYFGASTGAAAALWAAADDPLVRAVVSRGGRPDLAAPRLAEVQAPTLLIVGGEDRVVLGLNREAQAAMTAECRLEVVPGATHLFEEPGALEAAARLAVGWFEHRLATG